MEAATLIALPSPADTSDRVRVSGDRIHIADLTIVDASAAAVVGGRSPEARAALVERALRIGLTALGDAGASMDVDVVRREFESLLRQTESVNERVASQVDALLRQNFADGDGRLPRTLER